MCQSKAHGGKRCENANATRHAKARIRARIRSNSLKGNDELIARDEQMLVHLTQARDKYGDVVSPLELRVDPSVENTLDGLRNLGYTPLIVGGSVRDAIGGDLPKDIDIEVYGATIDEVAAGLRAQGLRVDEVGKAFGVLKTTLSDGNDLDVSVPRRDNQTGAGHRGFIVETETDMSVHEATERRDFTVNAICYDPEYQMAVDPHNGREDLKAGILRHVSNAFSEDPLRVLRGFQFAARFDMSMAPETVELCRTLRARASELPVERIRTEWNKFYTKSSTPSLGMKNLADTTWDQSLPGLAEQNTHATQVTLDRARITSVANDSQIKEQRIISMSGIIARNMSDKDARAFINATVEGSDVQRQALGLSRARGIGKVEYSDGDVRRWARKLSDDHTTPSMWYGIECLRPLSPTDDPSAPDSAENNFMLYLKAEQLGVAHGPKANLLQGRDVQTLSNKTPGPWMGRLLKRAQAAQDEGDFSTYEQAMNWLENELSKEEANG